MPDKENRPAGNGAESRTTGCTNYIHGLRQRRAATYRLPVLDCGHADPWTCHHHRPKLTGRSWLDAAAHLLEQGLLPAPDLDAMRTAWRTGGADRALALKVAERWDVAA